MPDDKNPLTETERALTQITGASRSEIRDALFGSPLQDTLAKVRSSRIPVESSAPQPPKIETTEQSFSPQSFRSPPVQATGAGGRSLGTINDAILVVDAVLYEGCTIQATLGTAVP
jgi:hypothetical protein